MRIPPSLCWVILACSNTAPLSASGFSKGCGISHGSVPHVCLIPFWTFVATLELIKEHLMAITCSQWVMLKAPSSATDPEKPPLPGAANMHISQSVVVTLALWISPLISGQQVLQVGVTPCLGFQTACLCDF